MATVLEALSSTTDINRLRAELVQAKNIERELVTELLGTQDRNNRLQSELDHLSAKLQEQVSKCVSADLHAKLKARYEGVLFC